ncbi:MAG: eCIS core domain-containing protein [Gemmatimonadales bacterium]
MTRNIQETKAERVAAERLTALECSRLGTLTSIVDCRRVRLYRGAGGAAGWLRRVVLRVSRNRAVALGNHVFLPDRCRGDLAVLAHELTHCGQYQAWGPLRYYAKGAAAQARDLLYRTVGLGSSPYRYRVEMGKPFEAYGMEQQAQIVEDWFRAQTEITPSHRLDRRFDAPWYRAACPPRAPARSRPDPLP